MSKKKDKFKTTKIDLGGKRLIEFQTASLNKHGELKGKNKKETKILRDTCMHHKVGKKGKLKSRVDILETDRGKAAHCTMCKDDFPMTFYEKDERKEIIGGMKEFTNHTKFLAAAINTDENTLRTLAEFSVGLDNINRINKKCTKVARKVDTIKKKEKKNQKNASANFGSWNVKRR